MAFLLPFLAQGIPWIVDEVENLFSDSQPQDGLSVQDADYYGDEFQ